MGAADDFSDAERVARIDSVIALGEAALGSTAAARRWLLRPNEALGGAIPIQLLRTEVGARKVESILGRALQGGFS